MFFKSALLSSASVALLLLLGLNCFHSTNSQEDRECKMLKECSISGTELATASLNLKSGNIKKDEFCKVKTAVMCLKKKHDAGEKCEGFSFGDMGISSDENKFDCGNGAAALSTISIGLTSFIAIFARALFH